MFGKLRKRIGQYYYRKENAGNVRQCQLTNLQDARKIGILYTVEDVNDYERVAEFVTALQEEQKEVKALGFVKNKNLIERFLPKISFDFFSKKDLTWFYKPIHTQVKDFIDKEFDLVIDLSLKDSFPIKYIAGLSNALCRVGKFSEENSDYYDLMIDVKPSMTTEDYFGNIRHYLTVINQNAKKY